MMSCTNMIHIFNVSGHIESIIKDYQIWEMCVHDVAWEVRNNMMSCTNLVCFEHK